MSAARAIQYRRHMSTNYSLSASQSILKQEPNFNPSQFHILIIQHTNTSPVTNNQFETNHPTNENRTVKFIVLMIMRMTTIIVNP